MCVYIYVHTWASKKFAYVNSVYIENIAATIATRDLFFHLTCNSDHTDNCHGERVIVYDGVFTYSTFYGSTFSPSLFFHQSSAQSQLSCVISECGSTWSSGTFQ